MLPTLLIHATEEVMITVNTALMTETSVDSIIGVPPDCLFTASPHQLTLYILRE
jgi:hypothetical protein